MFACSRSSRTTSWAWSAWEPSSCHGHSNRGGGTSQMQAVNGIGEPCAGEPHARFDAVGARNGARNTATTVGQPTGKLPVSRLRGLPSLIATVPARDSTTGGRLAEECHSHPDILHTFHSRFFFLRATCTVWRSTWRALLTVATTSTFRLSVASALRVEPTLLVVHLMSVIVPPLFSAVPSVIDLACRYVSLLPLQRAWFAADEFSSSIADINLSAASVGVADLLCQ